MDRLNQHTQKVEPESLWALLLRHEDSLRRWTLWPGLVAGSTLGAARLSWIRLDPVWEEIALAVGTVCLPAILAFKYVDSYRYLRKHGGKLPAINWKRVILIALLIFVGFLALLFTAGPQGS